MVYIGPISGRGAWGGAKGKHPNPPTHPGAFLRWVGPPTHPQGTILGMGGVDHPPTKGDHPPTGQPRGGQWSTSCSRLDDGVMVVGGRHEGQKKARIEYF